MSVNKVVQVPMDRELVSALDEASEKEQSSRSAVIRQACREYLRRVREEELDRQYEEGYRRIPEDMDLADAQLKMASKFLAKEDW